MLKGAQFPFTDFFIADLPVLAVFQASMEHTAYSQHRVVEWPAKS